VTGYELFSRESDLSPSRASQDSGSNSESKGAPRCQCVWGSSQIIKRVCHWIWLAFYFTIFVMVVTAALSIFFMFYYTSDRGLGLK
jgi:hypothetical protein